MGDLVTRNISFFFFFVYSESRSTSKPSIDFYKGIFLHAIPVRIIVPCFNEIWRTIFPHWYKLHDLSWCKMFLVVCLSIYYEKLAVKATLITMGYFFSKKLNFCPSDIIWNSIVLKCQCLKQASKFLIHVFCISNMSWREIISLRLGPGN